MTKPIPLSRAATQVAALLFGCLLLWVSPAAAFTPAASKAKDGGESTPLNLSPSPTGSHTSSGGASIVRTIVGLAIVIAVIWGLTWILRQVKTGRDPRVAAEGLASVAALTLGSGRSVHLVRAGSDYILLGSGEQGLVPIHRYTEQQAREAGLLSPGESHEPHEPREPREPRESRAPREPHERRRLQLPAGPIASSDALPDPMRMPSPSSNVVERLREWTVRR